MENRTVVIAGASGLVGTQILQGLLADPQVAMVHSLARRPAALEHPKLLTHVVDFNALPELPRADEAYLALGTTIKVAGSQTAFRAVDYDANLAVATAALAAGVTRVALVSAMGADPDSKVFYNRVKGELEAALAQMPFAALVIARPSLLLGDRVLLGQPARRGELLGETLNRTFGFLIPANYKPIKASAVASALRSALPGATGRTILPSGAMR